MPSNEHPKSYLHVSTGTVLGSTVFVILFLQLRTWTIMLDARTVPGTGIVVGQYLVLREM